MNKKNLTINKVICLEDETIMFSFENEWYQEDIPFLQKQVLNFFKKNKYIEKLTGADRESIRFIWLQHYYLIHFEFYSQSCWVEAEDNSGTEPLISLYKKNI